MNNIIRIPIGDWSHDGHSKTRHYLISSNHDVHVLREAYKKSCHLMGIQFNHNENYSGLPEHNRYGTDRHICTEYENNSISETAIGILLKNKCPYTRTLNRGYFKTTKEFVEILLWFIGKSIDSEFKYDFIKVKKAEEQSLKYQNLNGYWNSGLNVQMGYGLFKPNYD